MRCDRCKKELAAQEKSVTYWTAVGDVQATLCDPCHKVWQSARQVPSAMKCARCETESTGTYWTDVGANKLVLCDPCHKVWLYHHGHQDGSHGETSERGDRCGAQDRSRVCSLPTGHAGDHFETATPESALAWYVERAKAIGELVASKQTQYGRSVEKTDGILRAMYPDGVQPHQYGDLLLTVRILDKLSRIAQRGPDGRDLDGESPYQDVAGYALLGLAKDEADGV